MFNLFKRSVHDKSIENKSGSDNLPTGCMYCHQFTGRGCALTGNEFWSGMNVAVRPKNCPLVEEAAYNSCTNKKHKMYNLRKEVAAWVEKNIGAEYVDEALDKYDKINSGVPIGGLQETAVFVHMIEKIKAEELT